jgi:hypothetical protein
MKGRETDRGPGSGATEAEDRAGSGATNDWCEALGIARPKLESVVDHREAITFSLLLVALLERGQPMTLAQVAARFDEVGIAERSRALQSLKRCQPGRPPVYREGDLYHLDPHDAELDLWVFRLGLRPPKVQRVERPTPEPSPLPGPDVPLGTAELDEAWKDANLSNWTLQRIVVAVLDAHGGDPMLPADVVASISGRTRWHRVTEDSAKFKRRGSAVEVLEDGRWAIAKGAGNTVTQIRGAVRERIAVGRRYAAVRSDPDTIAKNRAEWEKKRAAHAAELARMSRALLVAFPPKQPQAAALVDVGEHTITTFVGDELAELRSRLSTYDIIGAVDVRGLLRALDFAAGEHRLAELGPAQKTKKLNKRGRTLKITTTLLVQGSCGISRPFGDEAKLAEYLAKGEQTKLRRRLEADAKSLHALYEYGRLHGAVRLRWGFLDEPIPAPWVHRDERKLYELEKAALAMNVPLEVVVGSAPGWSEPWSRACLAFVRTDEEGWDLWLVDEDGHVIDEAEVQRARLSTPIH